MVDRHGLRVGPLTTIQLALAAKTGLLEPTDVIWQQGVTHRYAAGDVPGLLPPPPPSSWIEPTPSRTVAVVKPPRPRGELARIEPPTEARRRLVQSVPPAAPAHATPLRPVSLPPGLAPTTVATDQATMTLRLAEAIARQIVFVLKYQDIRTLDDLASDERLRGIAVAVVDALPGSLRLIVTRTVGRAFVEARVVALLRSLRNRLPPSTRAAELHHIILDQAPRIAQRIDERIAAATNQARSRLSETWRSTVDALMRIRKPAIPFLPRPAK